MTPALLLLKCNLLQRRNKHSHSKPLNFFQFDVQSTDYTVKIGPLHRIQCKDWNFLIGFGMGTHNYEVLEISSDEEEQDCGQRWDWFKGLLDDEKEASDEVMIVGEVPGSNSVLEGNDDGGDDEECLILDGDPDKPVEVANDTGNDSDDLMVTGEKGQIACRDYPHPRHLCARYPFTTNPHEKYCDLCHCYVCETKAPCIYWGTGVSRDDHCHSSDKEEAWNRQRQWIKQGKPPPLVTTYHLPVGPPVHKVICAPSLPQPMNNGSTQPYIRPCSSQRNYHLVGVAAGRNSVAHPGVGTSIPLSSGADIRSNIQRERTNGRFVSPQASFKKVNRPGPGMCNKNQVYTYTTVEPRNNYPKGATYSGIQNTRSKDHLVGNNSELNAFQRSSQATVGVSQSMPRSQAYCQPVSQPQEYRQCTPQPQAYCQPAPQPQAYHQPVSQPHPYSEPMCQTSQNHINAYALNQASNTVNQNLLGLELHLLNNTVQSLASSENFHFSNIQTTSVPLPVTQPSSQQSMPLTSVSTQVSGILSSPEPSPVIPSSNMQFTPGLKIQLSSVKPSSELPPVATTNLDSEEFDLDSWIQSLEQQPDITGNGNLQSVAGFIPSSPLMFDFENL